MLRAMRAVEQGPATAGTKLGAWTPFQRQPEVCAGFFFFLMEERGIDPRTLCRLGPLSTPKLYPPPSTQGFTQRQAQNWTTSALLISRFPRNKRDQR